MRSTEKLLRRFFQNIGLDNIRQLLNARLWIINSNDLRALAGPSDENILKVINVMEANLDILEDLYPKDDSHKISQHKKHKDKLLQVSEFARATKFSHS